LLDRAGELLSNEGPGALSLRRIAADVGTSTTAVYSLFGGKPALVRELYLTAFQRFSDTLNSVPVTDEPAEDLVQLGLAYRRAALADPHLYSIMFSIASPGFEPDEQATQRAMATLAPLCDVVERGVLKGLFVSAARHRAAVAAWALVHGLVSLELNGTLPDDFDRALAFEQALRAHLAGWLA